jgi:hypothetical protein
MPKSFPAPRPGSARVSLLSRWVVQPALIVTGMSGAACLIGMPRRAG